MITVGSERIPIVILNTFRIWFSWVTMYQGIPDPLLFSWLEPMSVNLDKKLDFETKLFSLPGGAPSGTGETMVDVFCLEDSGATLPRSWSGFEPCNVEVLVDSCANFRECELMLAGRSPNTIFFCFVVCLMWFLEARSAKTPVDILLWIINLILPSLTHFIWNNFSL